MTPSPTRPKVLIVDDDPFFRSLLTETLALSGCICDEASDGLDALMKLKNEPYDLVVSDVQMPIMDGITLTTEVRNEKFQTPVVVISGEPSYAPKAIAAGAVLFLEKRKVNRENLEVLVSTFCKID